MYSVYISIFHFICMEDVYSCILDLCKAKDMGLSPALSF